MNTFFFPPKRTLLGLSDFYNAISNKQHLTFNTEQRGQQWTHIAPFVAILVFLKTDPLCSIKQVFALNCC